MLKRNTFRLTAWLSQLFTPRSDNWCDRRNLPYLIASLSIVFRQALQAFNYGTSRTYMVQDDARQHVFWMQRWLDPDLFPNDLIADYFQSVAPLGYQGLYRFFSWFGVEPLQAAKILPGLIAALSTVLFFRLILRLIPSPFFAFLGCFFLNQALWLEDGIISATPRAFVYPWMIGFLDGFIADSVVSIVIFMTLEALFYPQALLLAIATLTLPVGRNIVKRKPPVKFLVSWIIGLSILGLLLLQRSISNGLDFSPVLSVETAKTLPELGYVNGEYGRSFFFHNNPLIFWLFSPRSGFLSLGILNPLLLSSFALPWLLRSPNESKLTPHLNPRIRRIGYFIAASFLIFFAAHLSLFQLHLPARYTYYSLRITLVLLGAIAIGLILERWWKRIQAWQENRKPLWIQASAAGLLILMIGLGWFPLSKGFAVYCHLQIKGRLGDVYEFLKEQPKDILVASLAREADNIPTFAQRSVLAASEYAIPYHWGYYQQLRRRIEDMIAAEYSNDTADIADFIDRYNVDFWLVETWKLSLEEFQKSPRLQQFEPTSGQVVADLEAGELPILPIFFERCTVVEQKEQRLLDAHCIRNTISALNQQNR
ncbi:MAG: hypothetical protein AAF889_01475 [Cyanobacteria bacterium P01_D01_bin.73]